MRPNEVDIALDLLDDQLIDADGMRCGRVDDVELDGGPGRATSVAALVSGAGAWPNRVPRRLAGAFRELTPPYVRRIPWDAVADISTTVKLEQPARELGLFTDLGTNARWRDEELADSLLASHLLGSRAVTGSGTTLGRVREIRAERMTAAPGERVEEPWLVTGLLVGKRGLLQRFGGTTDERRRPEPGAEPPPNFVGWTRVAAVVDGVVWLDDDQPR